jgi:hypothetical protein
VKAGRSEGAAVEKGESGMKSKPKEAWRKPIQLTIAFDDLEAKDATGVTPRSQEEPLRGTEPTPAASKAALATGRRLPVRGNRLDGEPYAGKPHVRFGKAGEAVTPP